MPHMSADTEPPRFLHRVTEHGLEVPPAVEDAFDEHGIRRDDERNGDAALEAGHPQAGQQVVALCSSQRKCRESLAEGDAMRPT